MFETVKQCLACGGESHKFHHRSNTMMGTLNNGEEWSFLQCSSCDLVFLSPRVFSSDLAAYYKQFYLPYRGSSAWGKYSDFVDKDQSKIDLKRAKLVSKYLSKKNNFVLDVGCGKPTFLDVLSSKYNVKGVGIDFSDNGWKDRDYQNLALYVVDPKEFVSDRTFDAISMWHYLEHDYNPVTTLRHLKNVSNEETRLIIEVPNYNSYSRKKHGVYWSGYHTPRHTALYNLENMGRMLERAGYEVVDSFSYGSLDPYTLDWMSRMERKQVDWSMNFEGEFIPFVIGKMIRPYYFFDRFLSLGFMTVIAKPIF